MANPSFISKASVKLLTLFLLIALQGCLFIDEKPPHYRSNCKNHAYTQMVLEDYINRRYHSKSPVRVGVIPFSVPANFASMSAEMPGLDYNIAEEVQRQLLHHSDLSIIEVFNRMDWPGKKDEFFTGNFGAISFGRQANYDFVVVGLVPPTSDIETLAAYSKVIEVESGITVYYGKSVAKGKDEHYLKNGGFWAKKRPDKLQLRELTEELGLCVVSSILHDEPTG